MEIYKKILVNNITFLWSWYFASAFLSTILFYFPFACLQPARISFTSFPEIGAIPGKEVTIWVFYTFFLTVLQACNAFDMEVFYSTYRIFCVCCIAWVASILNIMVMHYIQTQYKLDELLKINWRRISKSRAIYSPGETHSSSCHVQSPLHHAAPFPWGHSEQVAAWWCPQLTVVRPPGVVAEESESKKNYLVASITVNTFLNW